MGGLGESESHCDPTTPLIAISGAYSSVHFFRLDSGTKVFSTKTGPWGYDLCKCVAGGVEALAVGLYRSVKFISLKSFETMDDSELTGHTHNVQSVLPTDSLGPASFGGGEIFLASGSADGTVRVFKRGTTQHLLRFVGEGKVLSLCCVPRKAWVVGAYDGCIRLWDLVMQRAVVSDDTAVLDFVGANVVKSFGESSVSSGCILASIGGTLRSGGGRRIKIFDVDQSRFLRKTFVPETGCTSLLPIPNRPNFFFSGQEKGGVALWDIRKESQSVKTRKVHRGKVTRIVDVGSNRFASCSWDGTVRIWKGDLAEESVSQRRVGSVGFQTGNFNDGLCCIVPFGATDPSVGSEERISFLLASLTDDGNVLSGSAAFIFVTVRFASRSSIKVPRSVIS